MENETDWKKKFEELEVLAKKESSGRDGKISSQRQEIQKLEQAATDGKGVDTEAVEKVQQIVGRLKERELTLADQERALNFAIEKGVPITLAVRNAGNLEELKAEVTELGDSIYDGIWGVEDVVVLSKKHAEGVGLDWAMVSKMSPEEQRLIPSELRKKLMIRDPKEPKEKAPDGPITGVYPRRAE